MAVPLFRLSQGKIFFIANVRFPAAPRGTRSSAVRSQSTPGPTNRSGEPEMRLRELVLAGAAAVTLGAMPVSAAPTVGAEFKTTAAANSAIDNVNYRRCWRGYDGLRRCRYV